MVLQLETLSPVKQEVKPTLEMEHTAHLVASVAELKLSPPEVPLDLSEEAFWWLPGMKKGYVNTLGHSEWKHGLN